MHHGSEVALGRQDPSKCLANKAVTHFFHLRVPICMGAGQGWSGRGHLLLGSLSVFISAVAKKPPGPEQVLPDHLARPRLASDTNVPKEMAWNESSPRLPEALLEGQNPLV